MGDSSRIGAAAAALAVATACGSSGGTSGAGQAGGPRAASFGSKGPWPVENVVYGGAAGIHESPSSASRPTRRRTAGSRRGQALYLLRPGEKTFRRYDAGDGLHLDGNPVRYCDDHPIGPGDRCGGEVSTGAGHAITRIVGGGDGEVFVGYSGDDETPGVKCPPKDTSKPASEGFGDYCDPARHSGKLDRVRVPGGRRRSRSTAWTSSRTARAASTGTTAPSRASRSITSSTRTRSTPGRTTA